MEELNFTVCGHEIKVEKDGFNMTITCSCGTVCPNVIQLLDLRKTVKEHILGDFVKFQFWLKETDVGEALEEYKRANKTTEYDALKILLQAIVD